MTKKVKIRCTVFITDEYEVPDGDVEKFLQTRKNMEKGMEENIRWHILRDTTSDIRAKISLEVVE